MSDDEVRQLREKAERLERENARLREERKALLKALFPPEDLPEFRPEDYPHEITSIEAFVKGLAGSEGA